MSSIKSLKATSKAFSRDFHEKVLSMLIEERRRLADMGCLGPGTEVAPGWNVAMLAATSYRTRILHKLEELPAGETIQVLLACASRLLELGEYYVASTIFFAQARSLSEESWVDRAAWKADATFGEIECEALRVRRLDTATRYPRTIQKLLECARRAQRAMAELLSGLPIERHEHLAWVFLNGVGLTHCMAEPLANMGSNIARHAAEFLFWCAQVMDTVISLSTIKYLPLRCRLYALAAKACDAAGSPEAVDVIVNTMLDSIKSLRGAEEMQLPLPAPVQSRLEYAELDCRLMQFRIKARQAGCGGDALNEHPYLATGGNTEAIMTLPDAVSQRFDKLLTECGLQAAVGTSDNVARTMRARAFYEALGDIRGLVIPLEDDDIYVCRCLQPDAATDKEWLSRERLLAIGCAEAAVQDDNDIVRALLTLPQMVGLARRLFVLQHGPLFRHVVAACRSALEKKLLHSSANSDGNCIAASSRRRSYHRSNVRADHEGDATDDGIPEHEDLVEGASVAYARELDLLCCLDDYMTWDEAAARRAAIEAATAADEGKDALKRAKKAHHQGKKEARRRARQRREQLAAAASPLHEEMEEEEEPEAIPTEESTNIQRAAPGDTGPRGDINATAISEKLEAALAELSVKAEQLTEESSRAAADASRALTSPRPVPIRHAGRLIELLASSTRGHVGEHMLQWRSDVVTDVALFVWRKICCPLSALIEESVASQSAERDDPHQHPAAPTNARSDADVEAGHSNASSARLAASLEECAEIFIAAASAVHAALTRLDVDDGLLRARVGLALSQALRDSAASKKSSSYLREAIQVVVAARAAVADARSRATKFEIHVPVEEADHVQLARQSITTEIDETSVEAAVKLGRLGAHGYGGSGIFGAGSALDPLHQALAAVELDLLTVRVTLELDIKEKEGTSQQRSVESYLSAENRKHAAAKAVVKTMMADDYDDIDKRLGDAFALLHKARERETCLLQQVAPWSACCWAGDADIVSSHAPPPPLLLCRTHTTISLQPQAWRCLTAEVAHLRLFGKAAGAGTDVSLTNVDLRGTGVPIDYDRASGKASCVTVTGLAAGDSYVFALAAFDCRGRCVSTIGETCAPIEAINPLPLILCYDVFARQAETLGSMQLAASAARIVYDRLVDVNHPQGHSLRPEVVCRASVAELFVFVECAFLLAGHLDNGGLPISYAQGIFEKKEGVLATATRGPQLQMLVSADASAVKGNMHGPAQVARLTKAHILRCAVEVAASIATTDYPELLLDAVWRCYHACLPLLKLRCSPRIGLFIFRLVCTMHQALWLVPPRLWDGPIKQIFACLTYRVVRASLAIAEPSAGRFALLAYPRSLIRTQYNKENQQQSARTTPRSAKKDQNSALPAEPGPDPDEWPRDPVPEQEALVEALTCFMREDVGRIVEAAALPLREYEGGRERLMFIAKARDDPAAAWEALIVKRDANDEEGDSSPDHPSASAILKMACRVLRFALKRGMLAALQSWLAETKLCKYDALGETTRRVLAEEALIRLTAVANQATSAAVASKRDRQPCDEDDNNSVGHSAELLSVAEHAAASAAQAWLPYVADSDEPVLEVEALEQQVVLADVEGEELLWLAEIEQILGLAILEDIMVMSQLPSGSDENHGPTARDEVDALGREFVFEEDLVANGPLTNLEDAFERGAMDEQVIEEQEENLGVSRRIEEERNYADADSRRDAAEDIARRALQKQIDLLIPEGEQQTPVQAAQNSVARRVVAASWHLARSACRARWARHWRLMATAASHIWNLVLAFWLSPILFRPCALASLAILKRNDQTYSFVDQPQLDPMPFVRTAFALLDFFDLLCNSRLISEQGEFHDPFRGGTRAKAMLEADRADEEGAEGAMSCGSDDENSRDQQQSCENQDDGSDAVGASVKVPRVSAQTVDEILADLNLSREFAMEISTFALKALACAGEWDTLVELARRLTKNEILALASQQAGRVGVLMREAHSIAAQGQRQIQKRASIRLAQAERALAVCERELLEATKQRIAKRRGRQSRLRGDADRSAEEIQLDERKGQLLMWVAKLRAAHQVADHYRLLLRNEEADFSRARPIAAQALDACRQRLANRVRQQRSDKAKTSPRSLIASYKRAETVIREVRERLLLAQALQDRADLCLAEGIANDATRCWHEGVDALFSTLDVHNKWRQVVATYCDGSAVVKSSVKEHSAAVDQHYYWRDERLHPELAFTDIALTAYETPAASAGLAEALTLSGCFLAGILLGKLALVSLRNDLDQRVEHVKFAQRVFAAVFASTLPHPGVAATTIDITSRPPQGCDSLYALYSPTQLTPRLLPLFGDPRTCSIAAATATLRCCILVLLEHDVPAKALSLCCLLEHITAAQAYDVVATARAKILRLRALVRTGLVAHAASVLAALLAGCDLPEIAGSYAGLPPNIKAVPNAQEDVTCLPFYGFQPFDPALPPQANSQAIAWIVGCEEPPPVDIQSDQKDVSSLRRGCAGMRSPALLKCYGGETVRELAFARAELVASLGGPATWQAEAVQRLRLDADGIAADLQAAILAAAWAHVNAETPPVELNNQASAHNNATAVGNSSAVGLAVAHDVLSTPKFRLAVADAMAAARCAELRARLALNVHRLSFAQHHAAVAMAFLSEAEASPSSCDESDASVWLSCRCILAECALRCGRLDEALSHCERGKAEAETVHGGLSMRRLELLACQATCQRPEATLERTLALLDAHRAAHTADSLEYVRCLKFAASLCRSVSISTPDAEIAGRNVIAAAALLDEADRKLQSRARDQGWEDLNDKPANLYMETVSALVEIRCAAAENLQDVAAAAEAHSVRCGSHGQSVEELRAAVLSKAERALQTMTHVAEVPAHTRATVLLILGRARRCSSGHADAVTEPLHSAIECSAAADHDYEIMREAALELVIFYAATPDDARSLQLATHYVDLAAEISEMRMNTYRLRLQDAPLSPEALRALDDVCEDAGDGLDMLSAASAVRYLQSLRREAGSEHRRLAARLHAALANHWGAYRDQCCFDSADRLRLPEGKTPDVARYVVCVQWVPLSNSKGEVPGLYSLVEAYVLLGVNDDERFNDSPQLLKINASKSSEVADMRDKIAALRYALQREVESRGSATISETFTEKFGELVCDVHAFLNPRSLNSKVPQDRVPTDASETPFSLVCDLETLELLEDFFNQDQGCRASHAHLCYFFRDLWAASPLT